MVQKNWLWSCKSNHFALFLEPEFPPFFLRPGLPYCHCPKLASLHLLQSTQAPQFTQAPPRCNSHPSSVLITILLYNGALLCGFNVPVVVGVRRLRAVETQPVLDSSSAVYSFFSLPSGDMIPLCETLSEWHQTRIGCCQPCPRACARRHSVLGCKAV